MIQKTFKIICDNCGDGINDYFEYPRVSFKNDNIIVLKGKHFCCEKCKEEYFKNVRNK